jgi:hypothetical protein
MEMNMKKERMMNNREEFFTLLPTRLRNIFWAHQIEPEDVTSIPCPKLFFLSKANMGRRSLITLSQLLEATGYIESAVEWRERDFFCPHCGKGIKIKKI